MNNGVIIKGVFYKAVNCFNVGTLPNPCNICDLERICSSRNRQYPCQLFEKKDHLVHFKKIKKED